MKMASSDDIAGKVQVFRHLTCGNAGFKVCP